MSSSGFHTPCVLSGKDKLVVTLIDANHCPGAVLFLVQHGNLRFLHTGDFRANAEMCRLLNKEAIDIVYLDTAYLDSKYSFPLQEVCIKVACELAMYYDIKDKVTLNEDLFSSKKIHHWFTQDTITNNENDDTRNQKLVVVVGTYSLGKERIFIGNVVFFIIKCKY
jgi:DNA cross-link repair 1A protein